MTGVDEVSDTDGTAPAPELFRHGGHELTVDLVDGPVGAETVREVRVVDAG